jgi:hypothetical protein
VVFDPSFEKALSTSRFGRYRAVATDDDHAWRLYRWNLDLVAAVSPLGSDLEVTLRNTISDQLTGYFGRPDWWADPNLALDDETAANISRAVKKYQKRMTSGQVGPGKVIAELMLGTWVLLLGRGQSTGLGRPIDYEARLWRPVLRFGFDLGTKTPKGRSRRPTRDAVHLRARNFQLLRNRCAHHEPVFDGIRDPATGDQTALMDVWEQAIELLTWMAPELSQLHLTANALPSVVAARP